MTQYRTHRYTEVLVVQACGAMGVSGFRGLRELLADQTRQQRFKRVLVDLRRADVTLDGGTLEIATSESLRSPFREIDAGLLVPPGTDRLAWQHCLAMSAQGATRLWFTAPEAALAWAGLASLPAFTQAAADH